MNFRSTLALAVLLAATTLAQADPTVKGFWEARDNDGNPTAWFLFNGNKDDVYSARLVKGFKRRTQMRRRRRRSARNAPAKRRAPISWA
jgi:hypothetical protein